MSAHAQPQVFDDPFLSELDEIQQRLNHLRDRYITEKLAKPANRLVYDEPESLTVAQVAEELTVKESTVRAGAAGTDCLFQGRIKDGANVRYPRGLVDIHKRNRRQNGKCGTCHTEYRNAIVVPMKRV